MIEVPSALGGPQIRPVNYQIWYEGTRRIRLGINFSGLVYAPNATVELPFNGTMTGAIVANRIIGEGNNRYQFDASLLQQVFR